MCIQVLCPFKNQVIYLSITYLFIYFYWIVWVLYIFWVLTHAPYIWQSTYFDDLFSFDDIWHILFSYIGCCLSLCGLFPYLYKGFFFFKYMWSTSVFFVCALVSYPKHKLLSTPISWHFYSIFLSWKLTVSGLTFKYLIHVQLIFVYSVIKSIQFHSFYM